MAKDFEILGICGSLRRQSYNKSLLLAAYEVLPEGVTLKTFDIANIPPFNQDLELDPPQPVRELKQAVRAADAILFVTPEYNYSIPGVLKNALDSASRPHGDNVWEGKPVAVMGASTGLVGTARAQYHLRQSFVFLNMYPVNRPEVLVTFAAQKFDENGKLLDPVAKQLIGQLLTNLVSWSRRLTEEPAGVLAR